MDGGKPFEQAVKERTAMFPQYAEPLKLYQNNWMETMGEEIPDMYDLIKSLKTNGFPIIYGLTNWSAETFPTVQKKYQIFSLIDKIIVSGEVKQLKPNPEIYHTLLNTFHLKAGESLFIDDNINNVEGARRIGINALQFKNAGKLKEDLTKFISQSK